MFVPLSVQDHLDRAVTVHGDRTGVVGERDQPEAVDRTATGTLQTFRLRQPHREGHDRRVH